MADDVVRGGVIVAHGIKHLSTIVSGGSTESDKSHRKIEIGIVFELTHSKVR
jgi:hypothetical protein